MLKNSQAFKEVKYRKDLLETKMHKRCTQREFAIFRPNETAVIKGNVKMTLQLTILHLFEGRSNLLFRKVKIQQSDHNNNIMFK